MGLIVYTKTLKRMLRKSALGKKSPYTGRAEQTAVQNLIAQKVFVLSQLGPQEKLGGHWGRTVRVRQLLAVDTARTQTREGVLHLKPLGILGEAG